MRGLFPGALMLVAAGAVAGFPLAWATSRFEGALRARSALLAAILPLALITEVVLAPPSSWAPGGCLAAVLLMIAAVDALTFRVPDLLSLPLIAVGLAVGSLPQASLADRIIGAAVGFLVLAALAWAYRLVRGREGLGLGDAKLLAVGGAWVGWQGLPIILLLSAGGGLVMMGVALLRRGRGALAEAFAFGPPLAAGIWVAWLLAARQGAG